MTTFDNDDPKYRTVTGVLLACRAASIKMRLPSGREERIARALIHGADDLKVWDAIVGRELTFRLVEWKAEQLRWA